MRDSTPARLILAAALTLAGVVVIARPPDAARADCAIGSVCVQLDESRGAPGERVGVTVLAPCSDASSYALDFQGVGGRATASLEPDPSRAEAQYRFTVPKLAAGPYAMELTCAGMDAVRIEDRFTVLDAPDTATAPVAGPEPTTASGTLLPWLLAVIAGSAAWFLRPSRLRAAGCG